MAGHLCSDNDAKKDNDFIYHERIPDVKSLTAIGRASVVKPTALPDRFLPDEKELFNALVPVHIHQAVAAYELRKQEVVGTELNKLKDIVENRFLPEIDNLDIDSDFEFEERGMGR